MIKELENCFKTSKSSELVTEINWPDRLPHLTYLSNSVVIDEDELTNKLKERMTRENMDSNVGEPLSTASILVSNHFTLFIAVFDML